MQFINPKIDYAFKKIFGSDQSHDILISFLNALLYDAKPVIQDLEIIDPYLAPKIRGVKDTYVDVKATIIDENNQTASVIIEMQVLNVEGFEKRILYNAAKAYAGQLDAGERYMNLQPVIALTIADFEMFSEFEKCISHFVLKEKNDLTDYPIYDLELVFIELPKFTKELADLETLTDKWIYFMKSARQLESVPEVMQTVPEINRAFEIARTSNMTREELDDLEKRMFYIYDQQTLAERSMQRGLRQGLQQGLRQGLQQGLHQGLQKGLQQGRQEGELNAKLAIARQLLPMLDDAAISNSTGLSVAEIAALRQQIQE
ncbi:Rpn family recombination-promoting nuclease/putative transposase [Pseudanabaena sp. FACHB-1277]|uniref:Rpn family recombination-promoting nuclease/putative transposase n=1 Tax=Pseudanabaena cinerea FACHB-1277 TaxID=2949581 RepID=A0A926Z6S5_9CYAN|nr:Rpn family recombination-promoting nuclease/putative transposase [Pseudanabaena cinerea]MBD2151128.1 Rpn family recombination-promoting nuclease/putative transposase [Pseudanabaena cinerea FACHB-1277]